MDYNDMIVAFKTPLCLIFLRQNMFVMPGYTARNLPHAQIKSIKTLSHIL